VRLGLYQSVLGVQFRSSCLIPFLLVGGISFSHDEVKQVVGLFYDFVFVIASALYGFLYLNNEYMLIIIKQEKEKKEKRPQFPSTLRALYTSSH